MGIHVHCFDTRIGYKLLPNSCYFWIAEFVRTKLLNSCYFNTTTEFGIHIEFVKKQFNEKLQKPRSYVDVIFLLVIEDDECFATRVASKKKRELHVHRTA